MKTSKYPWVFWFNISVRRKWFSRLWKTRGANFLELQIWIFKISIGRPWISEVDYQYRKNYGSRDHIRETNTDNLKSPFSFLIGKYNK